MPPRRSARAANREPEKKMGPKDRRPAPPDDADDGSTQMLNVGAPKADPPARRPAPTAPSDPDDGSTQMLNVGAPKPQPPARRAAPTAPAAPPPSDDESGATMMIKVGQPLPPPPRRPAPQTEPEAPAASFAEPADEPEPPRPARRPAPGAAPVRPAAPPAARPVPPAARRPAAAAAVSPAPPEDSGATQMLDLRTVPTPEEMRQQALKKAAQANLPARRKKMPEEIEVPVEHLHEAIHEAAHGHGHAAPAHGANFNMMVALSSALLAVVAAVSALMAGHFANEAMIEQIHASDHWAFFQAKSIKSSILQSKVELLQGLGKPVGAGDEQKMTDYANEQKDISKKAKDLEKESEHHMQQHQVLARTVTLLQIAIALSAIAVLTKKKPLWYMSLVGGAAGLYFLVQALAFTPLAHGGGH